MLGSANQKDENKLGMIWCQQTDSFQFKFDETVKKGEDLEVTGRNVLSILSSLFDPLGISSPVLMGQDLKETRSINFSGSIYMNTRMKK